MPTLLTILLLPFAWLYAGVMRVRNWLYDGNMKGSEQFSVPVLNVGNLRVGGTGKTPHVLWLTRQLLQHGQHPAILSRGYGRQTHGYRLATPSDTAQIIGDEPRQYFQEFAGQVPVAVSEDRCAGIRQLLALSQPPTAVVLDDAYQHRRVRPTLNLLLTEQQRPFYEDYVLPAGLLRESRAGAQRADAVIVTKCDPHLTAAQQQEITRRVRRYALPQVSVFFSTYQYGAPVAVNALQITASQEVVLLTGIANPAPLRAYLQAAGYHVVHHAAFADHHLFSETELGQVAAQLRPGVSVFTTQKDAARLQVPVLQAIVANWPLFYIPIDVQFLADGESRLLALLTPYFQPHAVV
ncbi:tetraacyldisaccharide 4'-kinase [Hymenobacter aerilatus]|uniref:Tetraacyldisaccharide 4'-kinase n=1 Tax=Hymenobacter aerilatus TaxID=2932251 RepID=A0A8T9SXV2_9BACT|nr:tetraacyldisaccharide 4'-kinase [Hymenobacter aerilatus]UOR06695.1 tetraacyldisaccharide 4'-kinase [Hymenobacter aerilatus]